jgi:hypothetical protein
MVHLGLSLALFRDRFSNVQHLYDRFSCFLNRIIVKCLPKYSGLLEKYSKITKSSEMIVVMPITSLIH